MNIIINWKNFNFEIALVIFLAYILIDAMYAYYTLEVTKRKPYSAATTSALMHFLLALGVLSYIQNYLYLIPVALGSWVGTFLTVKKKLELKTENSIVSKIQ